MTGTRGVSAADGGLDEGVSFYWIAAVLLRERRLIAAITGVGILVAVVVLLFRRPTYSTSFTFLPKAPDEQSMAGLASLAGQFGLSLGNVGKNEQSPQFYADLLTTRRLLGPIATGSYAIDADSTVKVPLQSYLDVSEGPAPLMADKTLKKLREDVVSTSVAARTTGIVTVNIRTHSPYVSLAIARQLLDGLNEFNLVTRQSQARQERVFTEQRLDDARVALRGAEDELQRFLVNNRQTDFPALTFQRERLQREVSLRQEIVTSLSQKYEENRIREVRDTPVITVIEVPILAPRSDPRMRAVILLLGTSLALALGIAVALIRATWRGDEGREQDPALTQLQREWAGFRGKATA
jgi:uncharacterized protein involved in exopolysaccharide biosynthesis